MHVVNPPHHGRGGLSLDWADCERPLGRGSSETDHVANQLSTGVAKKRLAGIKARSGCRSFLEHSA